MSQFSLFLTLDFSGISLPVTDGHSVGHQSTLLSSFLDFTVGLLLSVKLPEFSVDHLFVHLRLNLSSLINELLLTLDLSSVSVELLVFFAELVSGGFESLVHASLDFSLTLIFTLALQVFHALKHLGTNLLRGFETVLEFRFILRLFGRQKLRKALLALVELRGLTSLHVSNFAADHTVLNGFNCFAFPVGFVMKVTGFINGRDHH